MRFKKFNDIENIRHAKVEEKPIKHYTGNIDEVHCSSPSKNTSAATKKEMVEMQGMFKQRNKAIEQSVKDHDPKSEYAIEKYLKENNLELNTKYTDKIIEIAQSTDLSLHSPIFVIYLEAKLRIESKYKARYELENGNLDNWLDQFDNSYFNLLVKVD